MVLSLQQFVLLANRVGWLSRLSGTRLSLILYRDEDRDGDKGREL